MCALEKYLKPKTSGSNISPFSSRNLPKNRSYKISDEDLVKYKKIVEKIGKKQIITLTHTTNNYLKSLITRKNTWEDIKSDMALKGLSGKNYIHSIGEWDRYIRYLEKEYIYRQHDRLFADSRWRVEQVSITNKEVKNVWNCSK